MMFCDSADLYNFTCFLFVQQSSHGDAALLYDYLFGRQ